MTYVIENWENTRHAEGEILEEATFLLDTMNDQDKQRLTNPASKTYDEWLNNQKYSPDKAEKIRRQAKEKLYGGVKA